MSRLAVRPAARAAALLAASLAAGLVGPSTASAEDRDHPSAWPSSSATASGTSAVTARLAALERAAGARLGVYAVDTGTGRTVAYRADERFAYASTIKALAAGSVLRRLDTRDLDRRLTWTADEVVDNSPVTSQHVTDGLTVRQVIAAAIEVSDNTAGNELFELLGGPSGLERSLRALGDSTTSVDRIEPALNSAIPGDPRDTTTPRALIGSFGRYVLGSVLPPGDRRLLLRSLDRASTGLTLIRAQFPAGWRVGDKTGSAAYGTRNDVAVVRPPGRAPILVAVLTTHDDPDAATDDALVAAAAKVVADRLA